MAAEDFVQRLAESGDPQAFLDQRNAELTPELAESLRALTGEALKAGAFDYVVVAGNVAASVNLRLGARPEALACSLLALQAEFQQAATVEEYEAVRTQLLQAEERVKETEGAAQTGFEARGFAVQCGYFACEAASSPEPAESLIRQSLEDMLVLLDSQPSPLPPERVSLFMAFAFPTLDLATARLWLDEEGGIAAALRRLAAQLEEAIPAEAPLSEDPSRDAAMADVLARLAARHGS